MARRRRRKILTFILDKMAPRGGWRGINAQHAARVCLYSRPKRGQIPGWPPQVSQAGRLGTHLLTSLGKKMLNHCVFNWGFGCKKRVGQNLHIFSVSNRVLSSLMRPPPEGPPPLRGGNLMT